METILAINRCYYFSDKVVEHVLKFINQDCYFQLKLKNIQDFFLCETKYLLKKQT